MVPSGTRAYLWNFDCEPSKESLIKQTVEDAAGRYKLGRISMRSSLCLDATLFPQLLRRISKKS